MQLESHATPAVESPQQRYATLHRAIERGLESDEVWKELAEVSVKLGHGDEAIRCMHKVRDEGLRRLVEIRLVRIGLIRDPRADAATDDPTGVPAASDAGDYHYEDDRPGLQDHLADAIEYLLHQHMPWLVLATTLAFPLVIGLGGFLTAGGSIWLLAAMAAIPGLSVLAVVGAMGRRVLLSASNGSDEVPRFPELNVLLVDARRFLGDAALVLGTLIAPSVFAMAMGVPARTAVPGLLIGSFFTPMAWILRQLRGDFQALSPVNLVRATSRCGASYTVLVPVFWGLFAPAAFAAWLVAGRPIWVQIAAIGPLTVLPLFVVSRLLGTWVDRMRVELGGLVPPPRAVAPVAEPSQPIAAPIAKAPVAQPTVAPIAPQTVQPTVAAKPAAEPVAASLAQRMPKRPTALEHFVPPVVEPLQAAHAEPAPAPAPQARPAAARPVAARPAAARPAAAASADKSTKPAQPARPAAAAQPAKPARPAQPAATKQSAAARPEPRAIEGKGPQRTPASTNDLPDLAHMPGAMVVSGRDRVRHGAAAPVRPK